MKQIGIDETDVPAILAAITTPVVISLNQPGQTVYNYPLTIENIFANNIDLYVYNDAGFRAPILRFYKSRGTKASPTPPTLTGYEQDSIGGINFGGYNGSAWVVAAGIYTQVNQNWSTGGNNGAGISIYGSNNGSSTVQQIMSFCTLDPNDQVAMASSGPTNNTISYRPIAFNSNKNVSPMIKGTSSPAKISIRLADDTGDAAFACGAASFSAAFASGFKPQALTVATLPSASANPGWIYEVTDSSVTTYRSTVSGGGSNRVDVKSNGTNWLVN